MSETNQQPPAVAKTCPLAFWSLVLGILGVACILGPLGAIPAIICISLFRGLAAPEAR
jgi:hypothetical protein